MLKHPEDRDDLENNKKLLADNLAKYPKNQELISAIDEAILMLDAGELKPMTSKTNGSFEVYNCRYKSTRRKNPKGLYLCYNVSIKCQFGMKYPWLVSIDNYFAPSESGKVNHEHAESFKSASIRLNDADWVYCLSQFENGKKMFELINFPELLKRANQIAREQAEAAKAKKAQ